MNYFANLAGLRSSPSSAVWPPSAHPPYRLAPDYSTSLYSISPSYPPFYRALTSHLPSGTNPSCVKACRPTRCSPRCLRVSQEKISYFIMTKWSTKIETQLSPIMRRGAKFEPWTQQKSSKTKVEIFEVESVLKSLIQI